MIARSNEQIQPVEWLDELRCAYHDPVDLLRDLGLGDANIALAPDAAGFPFRVPRAFARRMRHADPNDPLLLQVLPRLDELARAPAYSRDPVGELGLGRTKALLQKYHGRALLVATGGCAINCRYCFRRHFPYAQTVGRGALAQAMAELRGDRSLSEIILSGGDPLLLSDAALGELVCEFERIAHLRRLRIHTRLPITIPARITDNLLKLIGGSRLRCAIVFHVNHVNEIDAEVGAAFERCRRAGLQLFNQSVLLRGVNDNVATLAALSETLFDNGVVPYYVHLLDRVEGAAHFEVDEGAAEELAASLRRRLPGYLVPRFVREIPGEASKTPIA